MLYDPDGQDMILFLDELPFPLDVRQPGRWRYSGDGGIKGPIIKRLALPAIILLIGALLSGP